MPEHVQQGSVPSVPLPQPHRSSWTVRRAVAICLIVYAGGQLLAIALTQSAVIWLLGWPAALDIDATEKLALETRQWLLVSIQSAVTLTGLAAAGSMAHWGGPNRLASLNLTPIRLPGQTWVGVLLLTLAVKFSASLIAAKVSGSSAADLAKDVEPFMSLARDTALWSCFLATVILAAVLEEIVFRGILSRTLEATRLGFLGGAGLSSALFALLHVQYGATGQLVVFALGFTFAWIRARYDSIWPSIAAHAFNNAVALLAMKAISG